MAASSSSTSPFPKEKEGLEFYKSAQLQGTALPQISQTEEQSDEVPRETTTLAEAPSASFVSPL